MTKKSWGFLHRASNYIYYYRRIIPKRLRPAFDDLWEIKKSLKTRDKSLATLRLNEMNLQVETLMLQAELGVNVSKDLSVILADLEEKKHFLAEHDTNRRKAIWSGITMLLRNEPMLDDNEKVIRPAKVSVDGENLVDSKGKRITTLEITIALSSADKKNIPVISEEAEARLGHIKDVHWFDLGKGNEFKSLTPLYVEQQISTKKLYPIYFSQMVEGYLDFRTKMQERTKDNYRGEFAYFIGICGDIGSTQITKKMMTDYRKALRKFPSNMKKMHPSLTFKEVAKEIAKNPVPAEKLMSPSTINKYIQRISAMFRWAVDESHMVENVAPTEKLSVSPNASVKPFELDELKKYFMDSSVHKCRETKGNKLELFWLPLISLYSGMRLEEIAQLHIRDIKNVEDKRTGEKVLCFDINKNGERSVKNNPAIRLVPIHSELIKLGLLKYLRARKKESHLLWTLERTKSGDDKWRYSHLFSKRHSTYLRNKVEITDPTKKFHSFRHNAIEAAREAPFTREDYMKVMFGHGHKDTTGKHYFANKGISKLKQVVEGIEYPDLDLRHLYQE